MKYFLTGATGFIGSHVLDLLVKQHSTAAYLIRESSDAWRIKYIDENALDIKGDLSDTSTFEKAFKDFAPDVVMHLGWEGVENAHRNDPTQKNNIETTMNLLKLSHEAGVQHFVGLGSQAEYGPCEDVIDEEQETNPVCEYGKAKLEAFEKAKTFCEEHNMRFAWLRLFSSYGPKDNPNWLISFLILSLLDGKEPELTPCEQEWDYVYVKDVARAIVATAQKEAAEGVFNLGSGKAKPLSEIVTMVRDLIDPNLPLGIGKKDYREDQVMHLEADITKLSKATSWKPSISLKEGLEETIAWYKEHQSRYA